MEITTEKMLQKIGILVMANDAQAEQTAQLEEDKKLLKNTITEMAAVKEKKG